MLVVRCHGRVDVLVTVGSSSQEEAGDKITLTLAHLTAVPTVTLVEGSVVGGVNDFQVRSTLTRAVVRQAARKTSRERGLGAGSPGWHAGVDAPRGDAGQHSVGEGRLAARSISRQPTDTHRPPLIPWAAILSLPLPLPLC
jgi:hypothetical protein